MEYLTWGQIKAEVQKDHGIEGDPDYDEQELINLANRSINIVEARLMSLQQDYFISTAEVPVTNGVTEYDLPSDIYASKIRRVFWDQEGYNVKRLYRATNIDEMEVQNNYYGYYTTEYKRKLRYMIINTSPTNRKIRLSYSDSDATLKVYYTRNANRFTVTGGDTQVCDIPEFSDAVIAYMKYLIELKDKSPTTESTKRDFDEIMQLMVTNMSTAVNDEDTMINPDTEIYDDHV